MVKWNHNDVDPVSISILLAICFGLFCKIPCSFIGAEHIHFHTHTYIHVCVYTFFKNDNISVHMFTLTSDYDNAQFKTDVLFFQCQIHCSVIALVGCYACPGAAQHNVPLRCKQIRLKTGSEIKFQCEFLCT